MLNRATALLNFADADAQFQRRYCSISPAEALNFNAVCKKRRRAVKVAKVINSIEGVPIPDETNEFFWQWIDGEISDDQLTEIMLSLCKRI